jgi:hypothetical protein
MGAAVVTTNPVHTRYWDKQYYQKVESRLMSRNPAHFVVPRCDSVLVHLCVHACVEQGASGWGTND